MLALQGLLAVRAARRQAAVGRDARFRFCRYAGDSAEIS
jgi:hypothetical protein